jgi:hypothetical protein
MNGSISPSGPSSSSGTATPTTPRESVSSSTSPSPLSQPAQTANHKQEYGLNTDINSQTNIGRMPRHDEELSPKSVTSKFLSKQARRSENEPLSRRDSEEKRSEVEVTVSGAGDGRK